MDYESPLDNLKPQTMSGIGVPSPKTKRVYKENMNVVHGERLHAYQVVNKNLIIVKAILRANTHIDNPPEITENTVPSSETYYMLEFYFEDDPMKTHYAYFDGTRINQSTIYACVKKFKEANQPFCLKVKAIPGFDKDHVTFVDPGYTPGQI